MQQFTGLFLINIGSLKDAEPSNATVAVAGAFSPKQDLPDIVKVTLHALWFLGDAAIYRIVSNHYWIT